MSVTAWGVDYAWEPHPGPSVLRSQGKTFACRYIGTNIDDAKMLTASEYASLRAQGVDVVANVEGSPGGFRGYAAGQRWANNGVAWINSRGLDMPAGRPIYFSADWDVTSADWPDLKAALDGAASVIGRDRVGLYGGLRAIQNAQSSGAAKWFWQTYGWSTRNNVIVWADGTHIQQYNNGVRIDGADCDLNRAMQPDFGQWGYQGVNMDWDDPLYNKGDNTTDNSKRTVRQAIEDVEKTDGVWRGAFDLKTAGIDPNSPLGKVIAAIPDLPKLGRIDDIEAKIDQLGTALATIANTPPVQLTQDQINEGLYEALKRVFAPTA